MKFFQWLRAHLLKVMLSVVATLLIVQYWRQFSVSSNYLEPLLLIKTSGKFRDSTENETIFAGIYELVNGSSNGVRNVSEEYAAGRKTGESSICPPIPPNLKGPIKIVREFVDYWKIEKDLKEIEAGGRYEPKVCKPRYRVALVIPYRDRVKHLNIYLNNMHRFLTKQQIGYRIFVVEQKGDAAFNRGKLMNIGYEEANKIGEFDCFIFHDVDLIPEDERNLYTCPEQPRHMSVAIDVYNYKLLYNQLFGGVCAFTKEHFKLVNGFSNLFWGWGGEDDDLYNRVKRKGLHVSRYPPTIARYTMLPHEKQSPNAQRFELIKRGSRENDYDGLSSLAYSVKVFENKKLYTWILADIYSPKSSKWWLSNLFPSWRT